MGIFPCHQYAIGSMGSPKGSKGEFWLIIGIVDPQRDIRGIVLLTV